MTLQTLDAYLENEVGDPKLVDLIDRIASACWSISSVVRDAALNGNQGQTETFNPQGEIQKPIDLIADEIFRRSCLPNDKVGVLISEEVDEIYKAKDCELGDFIVAYDPLDGSSNLDVNLSVGSIFAISRVSKDKDELPAGRSVECAGYAIYGPSVMLVLTFGERVAGFTLDVAIGEFCLTHPDMKVPDETQEIAINASRERFWDESINHYVKDCFAGENGPRQKSFNMRWTASMVADVHRLLCRGGVFLYPTDRENTAQGGKLRLLYEAQPMAFIIETAGGKAIARGTPILDVQVSSPHQRTSVILGARHEVELLREAYSQTQERF